MTDDDKALVAELRINDKEIYLPVLGKSADRIEALSAENERIYKEYSKTFTRSGNVQIKRENLYTLQNALDLLGVALAEHGHTWSVEERTAHDQATRIIERAVK